MIVGDNNPEDIGQDQEEVNRDTIKVSIAVLHMNFVG
jgi:hypothetical protein